MGPIEDRSVTSLIVPVQLKRCDRAGAGLASRDVTRAIYLAFLAPDIVERIVRGEQPADLNVKRLIAAAPRPLNWNEQRRVLGFDG